MAFKLQDRSEVSKPCPKCKREGRGVVKLIVRTNRDNGRQFLGCPNWPDECDYTEQIPEWVKMRAAGATALPGFEFEEGT
jgi:ssDNA-binding Zn-finger/Zn-ribbon topoisomerase 1